MTTSTVDNKNKAPKTPGPIRTGAVVPIFIIFAATFLYFHFLFDHNMRKGIEWVGTYVHGAEVNVGGFNTSFLRGSFSLRGLQVTDKENPKQNLIEIGEIRFGILWDALLRFKFVIPDAGIDGIQIYSPRKRAGYVKPPEPPSSSPSALAQMEQQITGQAKEQFAGNALGDIAALIEGTDEKELLKNIKDELKAEAKIKSLKSELAAKEKAWKERIANLPKKDEFESLVQQAKALKFDSSNPKQFADDLKALSKITKDADKKIDAVKSTSKDLKGDIDKFNNDFKQIDDLIKQDLKDLEARLKIPDLDLKDFSKNIFGNMVTGKLVTAQKYMKVARQYMPPPKDPNAPKEKEIIPPARGKGKNYKFPITTGYPFFWLKNASISSKPTSAGFAGDVAGRLTDLSSDPSYIKKPMILDVKGDFPKAEIFDTQLKLTIDHVISPKESLEVNVGRFPIQEITLAKGSNMELGLKRANAKSQFLATLADETVNISLRNEFRELNYKLESSSAKTKEVIHSILSGIAEITLNANITGSWRKLDFHMNSNLGQELSLGLKKYVQEKVDALRAQLRKSIDDKIGAERESLNAEYAKVKGQLDSTLNSKTQELEAAKTDLKNQAQGQKASSKDKLKDELKQKSKKLLKGIKF